MEWIFNCFFLRQSSIIEFVTHTMFSWHGMFLFTISFVLVIITIMVELIGEN